MAGVPVPATVDLPSLVPLLTSDKSSLHEDFYGAYIQTQRLARTERWKLILTPDAGMVQLFDVQADPWERTNLAAEPGREALIDDLYARLKRWMKAVGDPLPVAKLDAALATFRVKHRTSNETP